MSVNDQKLLMKYSWAFVGIYVKEKVLREFVWVSIFFNINVREFPWMIKNYDYPQSPDSEGVSKYATASYENKIKQKKQEKPVFFGFLWFFLVFCMTHSVWHQWWHTLNEPLAQGNALSKERHNNRVHADNH